MEKYKPLYESESHLRAEVGIFFFHHWEEEGKRKNSTEVLVFRDNSEEDYCYAIYLSAEENRGEKIKKELESYEEDRIAFLGIIKITF